MKSLKLLEELEDSFGGLYNKDYYHHKWLSLKLTFKIISKLKREKFRNISNSQGMINEIITYDCDDSELKLCLNS